LHVCMGESRSSDMSCAVGRAPTTSVVFTVALLTVNDVYEIAKLIGAEVERLIDGYGKESVEGLVPKIVKVLELLESFASRNHAHVQREEELLKTLESIQIQQQKKKKDGDEGLDKEIHLREKELQWRKRCEELQLQVQQLQEEKEGLQNRLKGNHAQEDRVQRQEREVMLKLKQVVDKQRDELRAKVQENATISKEVEALQEQLERFMKMNGELRHKQNVLQAQLTSAVERKTDMEADLKEKHKVIEKLQAQLNNTNSITSVTRKSKGDTKDPEQPCFTKKELRDIIFERNELKTNLFLVQEELNYYQREILNEERCPGFLLEAVRSKIKQRRRLIKAKMLGIPVSSCSSRCSIYLAFAKFFGVLKWDSGGDECMPVSLHFGFLTLSGGSSRSPTHISNSASSWEIIGDSEGGEEQRQSS
uniref:RILP-like protein 2 n=1 Tax=Oryzias sinensis TaxID=183150 RepID=A0A8C7YGX0_9TELE